MTEKLPGKLNIPDELKQKLNSLCLNNVTKSGKTMISTVNPSVKHSPLKIKRSLPVAPPPPPPPPPMPIAPPPPPPTEVSVYDDTYSPPRMVITKKVDNHDFAPVEELYKMELIRYRNINHQRTQMDKRLEELGVKIIDREISNLNRETNIIFIFGMFTVILFTNLLIILKLLF